MHGWMLKAHMLFAVLSLAGFILRGALMLAGTRWRRWWVLRRLPHINDALLLFAGLWLAWSLGYLSHGLPAWLVAKLTALAAYIALGFIALRYGRTRRVRALAWVAALGTFAYILTVARTRMVDPLPLLFS